MAAPLAAGSKLPELPPDAAITKFLHALKRPQRLLVAVSGGSDSLGLLLALKSALESTTFSHTHTLVAATVDHGLRPAAAEEARQVAALCQSLGIPHHIMRWEGEKPQAGLAAAARLARYSLLAEAAERLGADAIVTGHTLDDQIETVAMRARRSSGEALGLAGMSAATLYAGRIWILRPLLETRRQAIRNALTALTQTWVDDPSNDDLRSERVRTRHALPDLDPAAISEAGRRRYALSRQAADWLAAHAAAAPGPVITISPVDDPESDQEVRDHALGALVAIIGGKSHRPSTDSSRRLAAALASGSDFRMTLSGSLLLRRRNQLFLVRERRGFLPLSLPPLGRGIWDGRYTIVNGQGKALTINSGPSSSIAPDLPGAIRLALSKSSPQPVDEDRFSVPFDGRIRLEPRLSLFAEFLPSFDQPLADVIARLIGAERSPASPI